MSDEHRHHIRKKAGTVYLISTAGCMEAADKRHNSLDFRLNSSFTSCLLRSTFPPLHFVALVVARADAEKLS